MATVRHLGLFPFCVPFTPPQIAEEFWPQNYGSIAASLALFWMVKEFRVIFVSPPATGYVRFYRTAKNEKGLVCLPNSPSGDALPKDIEVEGEDDPMWRYEAQSSSGQIIVNSASIPFFRPIYHQKANARLMWYFGLSVTCLNENGDEVTNVIGVNYDVTSTVSLSMTATSGMTFNVSTYGTFGGPTMSVHEYWPYDPGDGGGPIYDTTTGEQLRPFPA